MLDILLEFLKGLPPELATVVIAMIPLTELRASIPIAIEVFNLSPLSAIVWSVLGNMVPATIILIFIDDLVRWLSRRSGFVKRYYDHWVARTSRAFQKDAAKFGAAVALAIFVGIPLPLTGAWSGALAAFLFGIPKHVAFVAIFVGIIIAAVIVALVSLGAVKLFF